jgi:GT2 family glycosyltransferase
VTYNRINDLRTTLEEYERQTYLPKSMIVVDNAATDGTFEFLEDWKSRSGGFDRYVIHSDRNLGGAGGFALGMKDALGREWDFIFIADDDAVPEKDMFEKLCSCYEGLKNKERVAALCTRVQDQNGIACEHRSYIRKGLFFIHRSYTDPSDYKKDYFAVDLLSFVGAFVKRSVVEEIGLPLSEYFIHDDDTEYATRIRKKGRIVCVSGSIMRHPASTRNKDWVEYYETRNYVDYIGRHYGPRYKFFAAVEKYIKKSSIIAAVFKHRSRNFRKMNRIAISDAKHGRFGISSDYKPGQEIG